MSGLAWQSQDIYVTFPAARSSIPVYGQSREQPLRLSTLRQPVDYNQND